MALRVSIRRSLSAPREGHKIVSMAIKTETVMSPTPPAKKKKLLSFPEAISALIGGARIKREEWGTEEEYCLLKDSWLEIFRGGKFHAWQVSEGDLSAKDWIIL